MNRAVLKSSNNHQAAAAGRRSVSESPDPLAIPDVKIFNASRQQAAYNPAVSGLN